MKEPYLCKVFKNNKWEVLGVVHAYSEREAWQLAFQKWENVTSVYYLYACD